MRRYLSCTAPVIFDLMCSFWVFACTYPYALYYLLFYHCLFIMTCNYLEFMQEMYGVLHLLKFFHSTLTEVFACIISQELLLKFTLWSQNPCA